MTFAFDPPVPPALEGTEKQIAWAEAIRLKVCLAMALDCCLLPVQVQKDLLDHLLTVTDAGWWITHRQKLGCANANSPPMRYTQQAVLASMLGGKLGLPSTYGARD